MPNKIEDLVISFDLLNKTVDELMDILEATNKNEINNIKSISVMPLPTVVQNKERELKTRITNTVVDEKKGLVSVLDKRLAIIKTLLDKIQTNLIIKESIKTPFLESDNINGTQAVVKELYIKDDDYLANAVQADGSGGVNYTDYIHVARNGDTELKGHTISALNTFRTEVLKLLQPVETPERVSYNAYEAAKLIDGCIHYNNGLIVALDDNLYEGKYKIACLDQNGNLLYGIDSANNVVYANGTTLMPKDDEQGNLGTPTTSWGDVYAHFFNVTSSEVTPVIAIQADDLGGVKYTDYIHVDKNGAITFKGPNGTYQDIQFDIKFGYSWSIETDDNTKEYTALLAVVKKGYSNVMPIFYIDYRGNVVYNGTGILNLTDKTELQTNINTKLDITTHNAFVDASNLQHEALKKEHDSQYNDVLSRIQTIINAIDLDQDGLDEIREILDAINNSETGLDALFMALATKVDKEQYELDKQAQTAYIDSKVATAVSDFNNAMAQHRLENNADITAYKNDIEAFVLEYIGSIPEQLDAMIEVTADE